MTDDLVAIHHTIELCRITARACDNAFKIVIAIHIATDFICLFHIAHHRANAQYTRSVNIADKIFDIGIETKQDGLRLTLLDDETIFQNDKMIG